MVGTPCIGSRLFLIAPGFHPDAHVPVGFALRDEVIFDRKAFHVGMPGSMTSTGTAVPSLNGFG